MAKRLRGGKGVGHILTALLAGGLTYRCQPDPDRWLAQCPFCRRPSLKISLQGDLDLDEGEFYETATLVLGCSRRCVTPEQLIKHFDRPIKTIEYEARIAALEGHLRWAVNSFRRYVEAS